MKMKKTATLILAVFIAMVCVSAAAASGVRTIADIEGGKGGTTGDAGTIYFGNYWQNPADDHTPTGTYDNPEPFDESNWKKEGIKWRVLANDAAGGENGKIFIMSDKNLFGYRQHTEIWYNDWETSLVRDVLGNDFINDAFEGTEQNAICETDLETAKDKIFLLELNDMGNYDYGFGGADVYDDSERRVSTATEMASHVSMYGSEKACNGWWWLRTGDSSGTSNMYRVTAEGSCGSASSELYSGVRPVLKLKHESVLFLSAAVGGKSDVAVGDGFALADYDGSNGWKLTLIDEKISTPRISSVKADSGQKKLLVTYKLPLRYTYLSALLYDENDKPINYARAAYSEEEPTETTAEIPLTGLAAGVYPVRFFCEKANGDKLTDYASELSDAYAIIISENGKIGISQTNDSSSSGGCNAGFGALTLLALACFAYRKHK